MEKLAKENEALCKRELNGHFEGDNGNVHRAAANIIVSKSRAARGSVYNVLLSRRCWPSVLAMRNDCDNLSELLRGHPVLDVVRKRFADHTVVSVDHRVNARVDF